MGQFSSKQAKVTFHKNHGEDIELGDDSAAVRIENRAPCWSNGLVFSAEPIKVNQKIYVKLVVVSKGSHDVISIGFTSHDPTDVLYTETENLTNSWTCSLSKYFCTEDTILCFYVNNSGIIHYGRTNGTFYKVWNKKVDLSKPVWVVIHIWNEPTTLKLINQSEVRQNVFKADNEIDLGVECREIRRKVTKDVGVGDVSESGRGEDEEICAICCVNRMEVVFVPCGHMCSCFQCGETISRKDNLCPICRKQIDNIVRVYRS